MNGLSSTIESDTVGREEWGDDRFPPPSSFFPSIVYDDILERLHRLAEAAQEVALLTGVPGAGKTTLLYRFQSDTPEHWLPCRVDANPMLHPDQLHDRLAHCIDLPVLFEGPVEEFSPLEERTAEGIAAAFFKLRLRGRLPVVLVDDAEQLPISSLMALLRLHEQSAGDQPACALILLAQPEIEQTLTTHQLRAMGTARFVRLELPRLAEEETAEYVRHFLRMEGVEQSLDFDPQQLAALHRESGGLPGKVNELVVATLRDAIIHRKDPLPERIFHWFRRIPPITALATVVVALLLLSTFFFHPKDESLTDDAPELAVTPSPPLEEVVVENQPLADSAVEPNEVSVQPLPLPPVGDDSISQTEPTPDIDDSLENGAIPSKMEESESMSEQLASEPAEVQVVEEPAPVEKPPSHPEPIAADTVTKEVSVPSPKPALEGPQFKREQWLLKQRPNAYTLQILATGSESSVREFARKHQLSSDVYYFKTRRNGRPWVALLFGLYEDRSAASAVLNMLPEPLREAGAWPRSMASVQKEIRSEQ